MAQSIVSASASPRNTRPIEIQVALDVAKMEFSLRCHLAATAILESFGATARGAKEVRYGD